MVSTRAKANTPAIAATVAKLTKAINEDAAMASLLLDNQSIVKGDALVDVIKCEKDIPNQMLRWGVASDTARVNFKGRH